MINNQYQGNNPHELGRRTDGTAGGQGPHGVANAQQQAFPYEGENANGDNNANNPGMMVQNFGTAFLNCSINLKNEVL